MTPRDSRENAHGTSVSPIGTLPTKKSILTISTTIFISRVLFDGQ